MFRLPNHRNVLRTRVASAAAALVLALWAGGCRKSAPPSEEGSGAGIDLAAARVIDLTYTYDANTLYWPTSTERFVHQQLDYGETEGGYFYSSYSLSTPEHGGTHLDAPIHFSATGWTADKIPADRFVAPAVVIDVADKAATDRDYRLTVDDVNAWEQAHGSISPSTIVLLHTGWGQYWPDALSYLGDDTPGDASNLHFPSYGEEAARLLIEQRGVTVLGIDTASIDYGPSTDFPVHRLVGANDVLGLENVAQLEALPPRGAWVVALPMKIGDGSGGPVRIIALLPES